MVIKKKKNTKKIKKTENQKTLKMDVNKRRYWEYYSLVIFLVFTVFFISMLIFAIFLWLGKDGLWVVIPTTAILWGLSYIFAKAIYKKR
jgi:hypothetical protein